MVGAPSATSQRVFFALWPDPPARSRLGELSRVVVEDSGGRGIAENLLHLTLAFLGEQSADRVAALKRVAASIEASGFLLALDELGAFRREGIAWLGASALPAELVALHRQLSEALQAEGFATDRRAYAPHLTLARRVTRAQSRRLAEPVRWRVASFALVESEISRQGPRYRTVGEWPLA